MKNFHSICIVRGESINYVNCHIQEIPENGTRFIHPSFVFHLFDL